jgi:hypothetical protein
VGGHIDWMQTDLPVHSKKFGVSGYTLVWIPDLLVSCVSWIYTMGTVCNICESQFRLAIMRVYYCSMDIGFVWKFVTYDFIFLNDLRCM